MNGMIYVGGQSRMLNDAGAGCQPVAPLTKEKKGANYYMSVLTGSASENWIACFERRRSAYGRPWKKTIIEIHINSSVQ